MSKGNRDPTLRTNGARILEGLKEALRYARGEPTDVRVITYIVRKGVRTRPDGLPEIFREAVQVKNGD